MRDEKAVASFDKALGIKLDDHPQAWFNRGFVLDELGQLTKKRSLPTTKQIIALEPDYWAWCYRGDFCLGLLNRANILLKLGRYQELRAVNLEELGRYEEAIADKAYDKAIALEADGDLAYYGKACCLAFQGKVEEACQIFATSDRP